MQSKSWFKRYAKIGPGGWKCSCCAPPPGKPRKLSRKRWKRAEKQAFQREYK